MTAPGARQRDGGSRRAERASISGLASASYIWTAASQKDCARTAGEALSSDRRSSASLGFARLRSTFLSSCDLSDQPERPLRDVLCSPSAARAKHGQILDESTQSDRE
eukprot:1088040-Pleurochrysis_carterae.AAC.2